METVIFSASPSGLFLCLHWSPVLANKDTFFFKAIVQAAEKICEFRCEESCLPEIYVILLHLSLLSFKLPIKSTVVVCLYTTKNKKQSTDLVAEVFPSLFVELMIVLTRTSYCLLPVSTVSFFLPRKPISTSFSTIFFSFADSFLPEKNYYFLPSYKTEW